MFNRRKPVCPTVTIDMGNLCACPCSKLWKHRESRNFPEPSPYPRVDGYDPVRSRLPPLVPFSKPSVTGARACRIATSGDRLAPATPSPTSAPFRRPAPVGLALPSAAAGPRNLGTRQTGDCGQVASQRLSDLLAMAITLSRTAQDEGRNTQPDPSNEPRQPALGRTSRPRRTAQARHRRQSGHRWKVSASAPEDSLPDLAQLFTEPYDRHRRGRHVRRRDRDV